MPQIDVCPWWMGYLIDNHIRRMVHDPDQIVGPYFGPGAACLDIGCGMGFFSLAMARMVGQSGVVHSVDVQQKMLAALMRRAQRRGLETRVRPHLCNRDDLGLTGLDETIDFGLACWMVHEAPDSRALLAQAATALRPGGAFLILEPRGHVTQIDFERTIQIAADAGLTLEATPPVRLSRSALLRKKL